MGGGWSLQDISLSESLSRSDTVTQRASENAKNKLAKPSHLQDKCEGEALLFFALMRMPTEFLDRLKHGQETTPRFVRIAEM